MITMKHYDSELALWNGCYDKVSPQTMKRIYKKDEIWQFQNNILLFKKCFPKRKIYSDNLK